ncbi:MAG: Clp protease ClpP [Acidimicrobiia bacterium]|jgi:ATP-dependent protease ClpP protease subunit
MARPVADLRKGRRDWYRIENKANSGIADVYIYGEIGYFGVTADSFVREFDALDVDAVNLRINSPGGEVGDGLAIYEAVKRKSATCDVTAYVDGFALSAASFILQGATTRVASTSSFVMVHNASGLAVGTAADMRELADVLDKMTASVAGIFAARTGTPVQSWLDAMNAETWYTGDEAEAAGLVDRVESGGEEVDTATTDSWDLSIFANFPDPTRRRHRSVVDPANSAPVNSGAAPTANPGPSPIDTDALCAALKEAFQ